MNADLVLSTAAYITLAKREERGRAFEQRYSEATGGLCARLFYGFDGEKLTPPRSWKTSKGAFGCGLAHVLMWARTLSDRCGDDLDQYFLFMEDDAVFCDGFLEKFRALAPLVPDDCDVLYLGGEHLLAGRRKPIKVAEGLVRAFNVNRLHAYVAKGRAVSKLFTRILFYLSHAPTVLGPSGDETCFDYEVGRMTEDGTLTVYAACPFLVGQGGYGSDTYPQKSVLETRFWDIDLT